MAYDLHTDTPNDEARARGDVDGTQTYSYLIKDGMCSLSLDGAGADNDVCPGHGGWTD